MVRVVADGAKAAAEARPAAKIRDVDRMIFLVNVCVCVGVLLVGLGKG